MTIARHFTELPNVNQTRCALSYIATEKKLREKELTQSYDPLDTRDISQIKGEGFS